MGFSAAASLFNATTEVRDRFWMKRYGPSRRRALDASAALRIFVRHPEKTFATISARSGPRSPVDFEHFRIDGRLGVTSDDVITSTAWPKVQIGDLRSVGIPVITRDKRKPPAKRGRRFLIDTVRGCILSRMGQVYFDITS